MAPERSKRAKSTSERISGMAVAMRAAYFICLEDSRFAKAIISAPAAGKKIISVK
jgi:hypothetical protein